MIYERIKELCKTKGISISFLEKELNFAKGYLCKIDKHNPTSEKLQSIANYLNTTSEYLMTGEKPEIPEFDPECFELIELYSKLKKEQKSAVINLLRSFAL